MTTQTSHFSSRRSQRGLKESVLSFILDYGTRIQRAGAVFVVLEVKSVPQDDMIVGAEHWVVILSQDEQTLITCFPHDKPMHYVRTLDKTDRSTEFAQAA